MIEPQEDTAEIEGLTVRDVEIHYELMLERFLVTQSFQ